MHANESGRSVAHPGHVERVTHPPHERLDERGAPPAHLVQIAAAHRAVARVELARDLLRRQHVDVARQRVVELEPQRLGREASLQVEVGDLAERVHARVRAPRAVDVEIAPARDLSHHALDLALHGAGVRLNLPAAIAGARVFERELEARHRRDTLWAAGRRVKPPGRGAYHLSELILFATIACCPRGG